MLDHVFTDAIGALRDALEAAFLERTKEVDERFAMDVLLGDVIWETSYGLPGEGSPPRVLALISFEWSTWSQSAYRSWLAEEEMSEPPRIDMEIRLRVQRLVDQPDPEAILAVTPSAGPTMGTSEPLERFGPTVETHHRGADMPPAHAAEVSYEGTYELTEEPLADGSILDEHFAAIGGWIASTLVRLGDLKLEYLPPEEGEDEP